MISRILSSVDIVIRIFKCALDATSSGSFPHIVLRTLEDRDDSRKGRLIACFTEACVV